MAGRTQGGFSRSVAPEQRLRGNDVSQKGPPEALLRGNDVSQKGPPEALLRYMPGEFPRRVLPGELALLLFEPS